MKQNICVEKSHFMKNCLLPGIVERFITNGILFDCFRDINTNSMILFYFPCIQISTYIQKLSLLKTLHHRVLILEWKCENLYSDRYFCDIALGQKVYNNPLSRRNCTLIYVETYTNTVYKMYIY